MTENTNSQIQEMLNERKNTHGPFKENAFISQDIKLTMRAQVGWVHLTPVMKESLDMVALKISRILSGDCHFADHWDDIAGYAVKVSESLND